MLNFTACAFTGSPFWNLAPLRILNSHVRSSTVRQDSARPPTSFMLSGFRAIKWSKTCMSTM